MPDSTITPLINCSTVGVSRGSTNILDPPICQAFVDTGKVSVSFRRPFSSASNTMYSVISLDMDAGGIGASAFLDISTVLVFTS